MSGPNRPSIQAVQRTLLVGILIGVIFGCLLGAGAVGLYIRQNPPVYAGGAYPSELTQSYQDHYLAMVIDSYIINRQVDLARERLKTFDASRQIHALGRWSANYMAGGRVAEAQAINELAVALKDAEGWTPEQISSVASQLATEFEGDEARLQALTTFANQLGLVPQEGEGGQPVQPEAATPPSQAQPEAEKGGVSAWLVALVCLLGLIMLALVAFLLYRRVGGKRTPAKPEVIWEGEGPPPVKSWTGTYTSERTTFDESFTVETESGAFVGEVGMSISETVPPKTADGQVQAFDVWLFDKTDITTYTTVLLSEAAYQDEQIQSILSNNAQVRAVIAEPGTEFVVEGAAIRVDGKIKEVGYGGANEYFEKLVVNLDVFIKEDADLKIGTMEVPEQYKL